jgi:hypothetical protein
LSTLRLFLSFIQPTIVSNLFADLHILSSGGFSSGILSTIIIHSKAAFWDASRFTSSSHGCSALAL